MVTEPKSLPSPSSALLALFLLFLSGHAARAEPEPIPDNDLEEVESPLVCEIQVSPIVLSIMDGGWWHDRSAAHLTVEDAILRKVGFSKKRAGRKNTLLLVKVYLSSRSAIQSIDRIQVELFDAEGAKLANKNWRDETAGREGNFAISGTKVLEFEHEMPNEDFKALWASGRQPVVRVTVEEVD